VVVLRLEDSVALLVLPLQFSVCCETATKTGDEAKGFSCCRIKFGTLRREHYQLFKLQHRTYRDLCGRHYVYEIRANILYPRVIL
jgi:hypothetical protein